ncbi:DNA topoisomerase VI, partial [Candidatus Woesearchaeota archaeon]|nr:DNA topoisomerase VI [Candidatus Woesearchaeota archaeon]
KNLLDVEKHASLRDVFYMAKRTIPDSSINIVDEQTETDKSIEDLELITDFSREQLNINANKMGSVAGKVVVEDKGDTIDWSKLGSGGWSIPSNVEEIEFKKAKAKYVIYMEKAAVWERLHEDKVWDKQDCIIMSSQGQTTRGIRRLLQRMNKELKLPIFVLCDGDPYGYYIYSVLKFGSISLAHMADVLSVPDVKYLGITTDDIIKYDLKKHFIKMNDKDTARLKQMADYDWFKKNKAWQRQFKMMKEFGAKVEIQALSSRGISFISDVYLPEKIKNKEWID